MKKFKRVQATWKDCDFSKMLTGKVESEEFKSSQTTPSKKRVSKGIAKMEDAEGRDEVE